MTKLTFNEFIKSKKILSKEEASIIYSNDFECNVYSYDDDSCYIEIHEDNMYLLVIYNEDWFESDLNKLEEILYNNFYLSLFV